MQNLQTSWPLAARLEEALRASPLSHRELALQAGVQYYAVRRMRLDGVRNRSRNAVALCNFFGISDEARAGLTRTDLVEAVHQAWDGTDEQGQLILSLVRAAGQYKVTPRS